MSKYFFIALLFLVTPLSASAAVAIDSTAGGSSGSNGTSFSSSHTNTAGTYMIAWFGTNGSSSNGACDYNGVSMTAIDSISSSVPSIYFFYLDAPATGSNNLHCTWTSSVQANWGFITFTGTATGAAALGTVSKGGADSGTGSVTLNSGSALTATDMYVAAILWNDGTNEISVTTGNEQFEDGTGLTSGHAINGASNTGTGTVAITWSRASTATSVRIGVPVLAAVVSSPILADMVGLVRSMWLW